MKLKHPNSSQIIDVSDDVASEYTLQGWEPTKAESKKADDSK